MKRFFAILLTVALLFCLTACGNSAPKDNTDTGGDTTTSTSAVADDTTTTTAEDTTTSTEAQDTSASAADTTDTSADTSAADTSAATEGTTAPATSATQAPTSSTARPRPTANIPTVPTTQEEVEQKSISILAVGNSFAVDAMQTYLYDILKAAGYDNVTLGILYVGGCSLDGHYSRIQADSPTYEFRLNTTGSWSVTEACAASRGFNQTQWDYVTVQQVSGESGLADKYGKLDKVLSLIKAKCRGAKILWHMTWAYQKDSTHDSFPNYDNDQMKMYNAIINVTRTRVKDHESIKGIIPCGTAIQNLRTSTLGDTLTADGYHLNNTYGDYTAALTWYCFLTGEKADTMTYRPAAIADHFDEIAQAVDNAIANPYKITPCK